MRTVIMADRNRTIDCAPGQGLLLRSRAAIVWEVGPGRAARSSDLELDADFHDLSAWNLEIRARPLGVVVHERERFFAPARHARPPAHRNDRLVTGIVGHATEVALRNLPACHRDIEPVQLLEGLIVARL